MSSAPAHCFFTGFKSADLLSLHLLTFLCYFYSRNNHFVIRAHAYEFFQMASQWSHSSSVTSSNHLVILQNCEKAMGWITVQCKMLLFCADLERIMQFWTCPPEEKEEEEEEGKKMKNILVVWQVSGSVLSRCFFFFTTRHVCRSWSSQNEWYIVIKAYNIGVGT